MTKTPSLWAALTPVVALLLAVVTVLITKGSDFVADYGYAMLLGASAVALIISTSFSKLNKQQLLNGLCTSARQTLPAVPILLLIGTVSATWMLSGVVPMMIELGLTYIHPPLFLLTTCCVCSFISLLTGSSWTTIATIGMAFMGIGTMLGVAPGWIAGAIISGAYFGDKMSPLSDTTVLAAASSEVNLFSHIRYMLITSIPSLAIALLVFIIAGSTMTLQENAGHNSMLAALEQTFNLTPWILVIPTLTAVLIILRVNTLLTLFISTILGLSGIFIFQPQIVSQFGSGSFITSCQSALHILFTDTAVSTGHESLNDLVATGGMKGMLSTIWLILSAMLFGGVMMGTGLLSRITQAFTSLLRNRISAVGATAVSGLFLNSATADQYLSIIIGANMYRELYSRLGLEGRLLSRSLEDSVSVTSVLIPWNSCGVTQSTVLGVPTLTYLPYCVFNYLSPLMSLLVAVTGFKIIEFTRHQRETTQKAEIVVINLQ